MEDAGEAYRSIIEACAASSPDARIDGVLVEEMIPAGLEVFIGARLDPDYGPVILLGQGGSGGGGARRSGCSRRTGRFACHNE